MLILDIQDVPTVRERVERCKLMGESALLLLALQWFGDLGHPQPPERRTRPKHRRMPDWGPLLPLDELAGESGESAAPGAKSRWRWGKRRAGPPR